MNVLVLEDGTSNKKLVFLTKVYKSATIFVNHTTTMFSHCEFLPFVVCDNFCIEISEYEQYIVD